MTDAEREALKKAIYEKISPRRKKFIEKVGYDNWDPFPEPHDPIDIRKDPTRRTTQQLIREFLQTREQGEVSTEYSKGAFELCLGVMNGSERHRGMYEFCVWYQELLAREGVKGKLGPKP
ncbi:hypothetical protein GD604_15455 [Desulfolutivibrio sulfoxidireducens]|nr:hypothetical protein GD605_15690 [Desulfolutivibrio sulfoxidireducens]QLA21697.1 hypothetical protein GD604_15455 [Desulfolutivibrio sulfoxidireducens]